MNIRRPAVPVKQNILKQSINNICSPFNNASESVDCSSHNESLKMREISGLASVLLKKRQNSAFE